jgi:hypothetical protein
VWSRPLLWLVALLSETLTLWGLTRNGYAQPYYAEAAHAAVSIASPSDRRRKGQRPARRSR